MDLTGQTLLGRYTIEALIGRGGMAEVYKAWDGLRSTYLALKVLHEELAIDRVFIRRFQREAQTLKRLQHPNIVRFYDLEETENLAFMVLDYIQGKSLKHLIYNTGGPLANAHIHHILKSTLGAVQFAHQSGLVHCDLKPGNILVEASGRVLVSDFGISRMQDEATATMVGFGTPAYMAPEQVLGSEPTPQTDIYALGVVLFEMLTGGERPFIGEQARTGGPTSEKIRWEQVNINAPSIRRFNPKVSAALEFVVLRCLAKKPEDRYPSALDLLNDLEDHLPTAAEASEEHQNSQLSEISMPASQPSSEPAVVRTDGDLQSGMTSDRSKQAGPPTYVSGQAVQAVQVSQAANSAEGNHLHRAASAWWNKFISQRKVIQLALLGLFTVAIMGGAFWWVGSLPDQSKGLSAQLNMGATETSRNQSTYAEATVAAVSAMLTGRPEQTKYPTATQPFTPTATQPFTPTATQPFTPTATLTTKPVATLAVGPTTYNGITPPATAQLGDKWVSPKDGMLLAYIPAGEFQMGSYDGDSDEKPIHTVKLDAFWMDTTEVTNVIYAQCVEAGECKKPSSNKSRSRSDYYGNQAYAEYPVVYVSWQDASDYCSWADRRLPTEAEWEKAARGGLEGKRYPWGNLELSCQPGAVNGAQYAVCEPKDTTQVSSFAANGYGLFDLAGNVWEWVQDWYGGYSSLRQENPGGPASGKHRVLRGGSILNYGSTLRTANRHDFNPSDRYSNVGFRCASLPAP